MTTDITPHPDEVLARQPAGYWTGAAYRTIVGRIRAELASEDLTQPHWWVLNHIAGAPARWDRAGLIRRLARFDDLNTDIDAVLDDLLARGWLMSSPQPAGTPVFTLTEAGEAGRARAAERTRRAHDQLHHGITTEQYAAALTVLRRMIANLDGDAELP
ncbi:MarR family transcriptional regulator [Frankia sp. R82]|uniref:MarR family transcriptional regulator n=1 Tax=Frankia sp. R82 TaxID=2950553 RepID=UPI002044AB38|nr:MarR family transcriptional regulator [Frankia sp. R82]MCM3882857.1 MarR family transcriptional regulator [Frankia sp. R82]